MKATRPEGGRNSAGNTALLSTGERGRPKLREWPRLCICQVIKHYVGGQLVRVERRIVQGSAELIESLRHMVAGRGVLIFEYVANVREICSQY